MSQVNKKFILEAVVFLVGASIMIYELVGSRILAPHLGTSLFVWTGIIGVILGALSIGYWWGGILADKKPEPSALARILLWAAGIILVVIFVKDIFLSILTANITSVRLGAALSSLILFAPASVLLGMVAPYAARLKMDQIKNSGKTIGRLYALSTLGSIAGTFFAGFYLIPQMGSTKILFLVAVVLLFCSLLLNPFKKIKTSIISAVLLVVSLGQMLVWNESLFSPGVARYDTQYNHVRVYDYLHKKTGQWAKVMRLNNEVSSSMFLDSDELVHEYTKFYDIAEHFAPQFKSAVMIGGAAYSYPKYFLKQYPNATLDVVEIDSQVTEVAKKHFRLKEHPKMNIIHEDGRTFLKHAQKKYDVFLGDAYKSFYSLPYHLTTKEAVQEIFNHLTEDGVAVVNIISPLEGEGSTFLSAEYNTFAEVFPQVFLFPVRGMESAHIPQNIMLVASKRTDAIQMINTDAHIQNFLSFAWENPTLASDFILTDDYAPVEYFIDKML